MGLIKGDPRCLDYSSDRDSRVIGCMRVRV